ncbi:MAG: glycyl-radical enzyme activating protein [Clostridia bacterium]|nr:glycyl-radical enzyme activating protein [Clostridia bacterium]
MSTAKIFDIQRNSFVDGPGIRTTVFFKGCNLDCKWCHNPESKCGNTQMLFYKSKCTGCGKCAEVCPNKLQKCDFCGKCTVYCPVDARQICGKDMTAEEVLKEILKDKVFYETSGGGVTFSGGECMLQIDFLEEILRLCKENGLHTAVDTAGNVPYGYFERVIPYTDLFLYDVKCIDEDLHKEGTGVSNKRILENLRRLSDETDVDIIIRVPVMEDFNGTDEEMGRIADFVKALRIKAAELLPYHKMGEHKYDALGLECKAYGVPSDEIIKKHKRLFEK